MVSQTAPLVLRVIARLNIGGPAIHTVLLTQGLSQRGFPSLLVTGRVSPDEGDMTAWAESHGVKPLLIPELQRHPTLLGDLRAFVKLYRLLLVSCPAVIHTHTAKAGSLGRLAGALYNLQARLTGRRRVKVVHTFHGHVFRGLFALILVLTGVYLARVKVQVTDPDRVPAVWTSLVSNLLYKRHAAEVLLDTVCIVICFYSAYLLRFEGVLAPPMSQAMVRSLPLVVASCLLAYFLAGIYRGQWRLMSVADLPYYAAGVGGGTVLSLALVTLITRFENGHSRSAYIIFGVLLFLALVGSRLSFRLLDALLQLEPVVDDQVTAPVRVRPSNGEGVADLLLPSPMRSPGL